MNRLTGFVQRPSNRAGLAAAAAVLTLIWLWLDAALLNEQRGPQRDARAALTAQLGLTDPALLTEARYGRHLTQADLHAPFQDAPLAFDHFPSGSLWPHPSYEHLVEPATLSD